MNEETLDLSEFHLTHPPGKPYAVFDPKRDGEYEELSKFLHIAEIEELILKESAQKIEEEGELAPGESSHASRIYGLGEITNPETGSALRIENDANIQVLFQVLLRDGRYTSNWIAFLCQKDGGIEALARDQEPYMERWRKLLELGHQQSSAGDKN